ncbi:MAG TPA: amino acid adenylation domain-containing protein [Candidatus Limnocylindrales bacterium]|nr:amino acid adenylation domain-containing protein [Candidatus Limnocylindrales bacterium]
MSTAIKDQATMEQEVALAQQEPNSATNAAPLSFAQQRLWFLDQLEPNRPLYNIGVVARLFGSVDVTALESSLRAIIARHESLRTHFVSSNEAPEQLIEDEVWLQLNFLDLTNVPDPREESQRLTRAEVNRPFDLGADLLIRAQLHQLSAEEHHLVLIFHHIVMDEWSLGILFRELDVFYRAHIDGHSATIAELPIQYSDFAIWQRDWLKGERLLKHLRYWRTQLSGKPAVTELTTDRPRQTPPAFRGGRVSRTFDASLLARLKQCASDQEATLFMVLLAGFKVLLQRYTRHDDLIVGSPIAGRTRIETEPLIGFFVNTLPLRTSLAGDPTFEQLLARVRDTTLGAYAHQDLPFERLVEELQPERSLSHMPFTKVMFLLQNGPCEALPLGNLKMEVQQVTSDFAKFELTLALKETTDHRLLAQVEYDCDLFDEASMARLLGHYERLLHAIIANPAGPLSQLHLLTPLEQQQLLYDWNQTKTEYPQHTCVPALFEAQVARTPGAAAISFDQEEITYAELNARANRLAHYLRRFDVRTGTPVGICLERSLEFVVAALAVLKAGAAYVPLDPDYPEARLALMLSDTRIPVLLTTRKLLPKVRSGNTQTVCLDRDAKTIAGQSPQNLGLSTEPQSLAYVMYTSGSTGRPKGVAVPHRAIIRLVLNTDYILLGPTDRIAQVSNISFDAATFEIWGALLNGAQLIGISRETLLSPDRLARELQQRGVTAMFLTAALFNQMAAEAPGAFGNMRTLIVGGEALDPKWIRTVLRDRPPQRLLNGYGPTENTTFTCCYPIRELDEKISNIPIGRPIANTQVYILDEHRNPVPIGVPGELYTGGDGLAHGYFGQAELTAEKFVLHPFAQHTTPQYLYRTGDLARYLPDGNIEFLGRIDSQVKLRGFRIELAEIETVLGQHPGIKACVVVLNGQSSAEKRLIAYFTASGRAPKVTDLRAFLSTKLPEYMLPSAFVALDEIPLTPNGKVDRAALSAQAPERQELGERYVPASDPVELQLVGIWEKVLGVRPVGIRDRFFDLGGHSLLAVRVTAEIEKTFGKKLRVATIFQAPTVEQLAAIVRDEIHEPNGTTTSSLVEIQGEGSKPPLFLVHGAGGGMFWGYVNLSRHLGPQQPIYAFKSRALDGGRELEQIEEMAAQYIRDLRRHQPHGPYFLGGYCFGGNVAYEMARQLAAENENIALLALLNCAPPNSRYTRSRPTPRWLFRFVRNLFYWRECFCQWTPKQRREFFRWKWSLLRKRIAASTREPVSAFAGVEAGDLVDLSSYTHDQRRAWEAHIRALLSFRPKPYTGRVDLFRSPGHPLFCSFEADYGWGEFAQGVRVTILPGAHEKILEEPCVEVLAQKLANSLRAAQATSLSSFVQSNQSANGETQPKQHGLQPSPVPIPINTEPEPAEPSRITNPEEATSTAPKTTNRFETEPGFWIRKLENAPSLLELPTDRPRRPVRPEAPARCACAFAPHLTDKLERLAAEHQTNLFTVLLAAFATLLHRYSGSEDIIIGTAVPRQDVLIQTDTDSDLADVIPLRCDLSRDPTFVEFLGRVHTAAVEGIEHSSVPLEKIIESLSLPDNGSYAPLFQVMFLFDESMGGISGSAAAHIASQQDLVLHLTKAAQSLAGYIEYNPLLFDEPRISRLVQHLGVLLTGTVDGPQSTLAALPLMSRQEKELVLEQWNRTAAPYPSQKTLSDLFIEQVAHTPNAEALVSGNSRLSYQQLYDRARAIAQELANLGIGKENLVGIFCERSTEMIASILGVLLAGAAYVPLDPMYPRQRLVAIFEDAKLRVLLTQEKLLSSVPATEAQILCVDRIHQIETFSRAPANPKTRLHNSSATDLAYVIYTSGSTGKPKGVALEHRGAVGLVSWARNLYTPAELSGVLASTSICFDLSVFEMFVPLCCGGKVILAENALALPGLAAAEEVSLINTVPSAMKELLRAKAVPRSVLVVNLAGEPLSTELVDQIYQQTAACKVYDLYGPTETTTYSTGSLRQSGAAPTIGQPLTNEQVYLVDKHLQPVPIGMPGELCIGGIGLAREYLNQPELTKEKFIPHPFKNSGRLYRTGDLARWRTDGYLEFLGRLDHQVKIRGFRIELGEIESVLRKVDGVREAIVLAREDRPGDKYLTAYIVSQSKESARIDSVRSVLEQRLPHYMVPSAFVFLDQLPLTPNGKIDRKALPAPDPDVRKTDRSIVPPRNETEQRLVAVWKEVLRLDSIGISDNFFEIGGHSLLAAQVVGRVRENFGIELPLLALFDAPTISALSEAMAAVGQSVQPSVARLKPVPRVGPKPVSFVQERLWFLDQLRPGSDAYNVPAALRLKGQLNTHALRNAFESVVQRHEALRTTLRYRDGQLTQIIADQIEPEFQLQSFSDRSSPEADATAWVNSQAQRPFDLKRGPLIRAGLAAVNEVEHLFLVVMHHTICDGWSLALFFQELASFYQAFSAGHSALNLPQITLQYVDYAQWQRNTLQGEVLDQHLQHWKQALSGAREGVDLPADFEPEQNPEGKAGRRVVVLEEPLLRGMAELGQREGVTQFIVLMTALMLTLNKWTGQKDLIVGTVVAGRTRREMENMFGCFMNFLPIRARVSGAATGREVLSRVRTAVLEGQSHQDCPFEKIVESVNPERRLNQNPLYNVALLLQNFPAELFHSDTLEVSQMPVRLAAPLLDLRLEAEQTPQGFALSCEYRTDLFKPATIDEFLSSLLEVLRTLVGEPQTKLGSFKITESLKLQAESARSRPERQTIAVSATFTAEPLAEPLSYWMKELQMPGGIEFAPYNQVFQQLLDPASLLGTNSRGLNVILLRLEDWATTPSATSNSSPEDPALERNLTEFASGLKAATTRTSTPWLVCVCPPARAVLADPARAAYFTRIETSLLQTLEPMPGVYLLTQRDLAKWYSVPDYDDPGANQLGHVPYTPLFFTALATGIARKFHALGQSPYKVIALDCDHTLWSGVCGEDGPQGVRLDEVRRQLQEFMRAQHAAGMLLCLCSKNNERDVLEVFERRLDMPLRQEHFAAQRLNWQPKSENLKSLAEQLQLGLDSFIFIDDNPVECAEVEANCPEVLVLNLPAEPNLIPTFLDHCWVFDRLKVTDEDRRRAELYRQNAQRHDLLAQSPSLADFLQGLQLHVDFERMSPGQLPRVAQLTQRTNQFNCAARRLSETDLQTCLADSEVVTVQVRDRFGDYGLVGVMLYRVEKKVMAVELFLLSCRALGRGVEHQMLAHLGGIAQTRRIDSVDVHFVRTEKNAPALEFLEGIGSAFKQGLNGGYVFRFPAPYAAGVSFRPGNGKARANVQAAMPNRSQAQKAGPHKRKFARCSEIALESHDTTKIHAAIEKAARTHLRHRSGFTPPRTDLETKLSQLWQNLLHIDRVGVQDNFFELGGHSLLAVRLFAELENLVGKKLPLVTLFQAPTVEQLACVLEQTAPGQSDSLLVPIQPNGSKPPLFLVHGAGGDVLWGYANLAAHLPPDQPVYGVKSRGQVGLDEFTNLRDMASCYLEAVRQFQPQGPYYLGGYCFGGNVAYEMARQLREQGDTVALIALLDSAPSNAGYETVPWFRPDFAGRFVANFHHWLKDFAALPFVDQRNFVARKLRALGRRLKSKVALRRSGPWVDVEEIIDPHHFSENELKLWQIHLQALIQHVEGPYSGQVTLLRTRGQPLFCSLEEDFCWSKLARGGVTVKLVPGSHENIFNEPNVQTLAKELAAALTAAQVNASVPTFSAEQSVVAETVH